MQQCNEEDAPAAKLLPAECHEERHGADRKHAAEVVEHIGEREARAALLHRWHGRALLQELPEPIRLRRRNDFCRDGRGEAMGSTWSMTPP